MNAVNSFAVETESRKLEAAINAASQLMQAGLGLKAALNTLGIKLLEPSPQKESVPDNQNTGTKK